MSMICHSTTTAHHVVTLEIRVYPGAKNCFDIYCDGERVVGIYGKDGKLPTLVIDPGHGIEERSL
jgi:hypothetical protein